MVKQNVLNLLNTLPDKIKMDDLMYKLYILHNHEKAIADIESGNVFTVDEIRNILSRKSQEHK